MAPAEDSVESPAANASTGILEKIADLQVPLSEIVRDPAFLSALTAGSGKNYRVPADFAEHVYVGEKARAKNNLVAVRLLKALDSVIPEGDRGKVRLPVEYQDVLSRFVGWGGLPHMFRAVDDTFHKGWETLGLKLEDMLSSFEMERARRSTLDAHYTGISIVEAMWNGLRDAGLPDAQMILEPSVGSGLFLGAAPASVAQNSRFMGCEMDSVTARIAQWLYPESVIEHERYEDFPIMRATGEGNHQETARGFDLVIGNPPFGDQKVYDTDHPEISGAAPNIHTYFFDKSLAQTRPGGVMAMVVSRYLLDAASDAHVEWRKRMALQAELKTAVRLPSNTFQANAGTQVITDILVFQRRMEPLAGAIDDLLDADYPEWVFTTENMAVSDSGMPISGNRYYAGHPEQLLGRANLVRGMYREAEFSLTSDRSTAEIARDIREAIAWSGIVFNDAPSADLTTTFSGDEQAWHEAAQSVAEKYKNGSWFVVRRDGEEDRLAVRRTGSMDGYLWATIKTVQKGGDKASEDADADGDADVGGLTPPQVRRIIGMCDVRDALLRVLDLQVSPTASEPVIEAARADLNDAYDGFVKKFGLLRKKINQRYFRSELSFGAVMALEQNYVPAISKVVAAKTGQPARDEQADKSEIFFARTQFPASTPDRAETPLDALRLSLSQKGRVDPIYMTHLLRNTEVLENVAPEDRWSVVLQSLEDRLLKDPETGRFDLREMVTSGDVVSKLERATARLEQPGDDHEEWQKCVDALQEAQPARVRYYDIGFRLGTPWIPRDIVNSFISEQFGGNISATYVDVVGDWHINGKASVEKDLRWSAGAEKMSPELLLKTVLNDRPAVIRVPDGDGGTVVSEEQSAVLKARVEELKTIWQSWLDANEPVRSRIEDEYNDTFNREVLPVFDGGHLQLAGASDAIVMRPHQKNGIWRGLQSGNTLFDHAVGAGKTFAAVALVMEQRRMGLSLKPMIAVPNHLVLQWRDAFLTLYPGAKLLVAEKDDMAKNSRQAFLGKAAYGEWDAIIIPHTTFTRIPPSPQDELDYMEKELEGFKEAMHAYKGIHDNRSVKKMERKIDSAKARIKRRIESTEKDSGALHMGNIGVDYLVVDEVQEFKNLPFITNLKNVSGLGNPEGSARAIDLYIKTAGIQKRRAHGGGLAFLTGTPLSNTLAEMYIWQRYLGEEALQKARLFTFDAWKDTFASVTREYGFTLTGEYKERAYLGKFENWPELLRMLDRFKDSISITDVREMLREAGMPDMPIPLIENGTPNVISVPQTGAQQHMIGYEVGESADGTPEYNPGSIMHRLDHMPKAPKKGEDNILSLSSELTKVGLDVRAMTKKANDHGEENGGKLPRCAESILSYYQRWNDDKGTQLVFLDFSTPGSAVGKVSAADRAVLEALETVRKVEEVLEGGYGEITDEDRARYDEAVSDLEKISPAEIESIMDSANTSGWSAYVELKTILVNAGIPEHEIAFIHDVDGDKKEELFGKVRSGVVRVLMGSSPKMGAGVNVQDRLVAAHHLDAPYRPLDLEQRNGRILRQGNKLMEKYGATFSVGINYYVTEGSGDPGRWQILEFKKRFIDQTRTSADPTKAARSLDDPSAQALDPSRVKAEASGSDVLMDRVEMADVVKRLEQSMRAKAAAMDDVKRQVGQHETALARAEKDISIFERMSALGVSFVENLRKAEEVAITRASEARKLAKEQEKEEKAARKKKLSERSSGHQDLDASLGAEGAAQEAPEIDAETLTHGFISIRTLDPLTGEMTLYENQNWKDVGILVEKNVALAFRSIAVSLTANHSEISFGRMLSMCPMPILELSENGKTLGTVNIERVADGSGYLSALLSVRVDDPDNEGRTIPVMDLRRVELMSKEIVDALQDIENEKKGSKAEPLYFTAKEARHFSMAGRNVLLWPGQEALGHLRSAKERKSNAEQNLAMTRQELARQSVHSSGASANERVLKAAKGWLECLESALKCGVRKYAAVDYRLSAMNEAIQKDAARKANRQNVAISVEDDEHSNGGDEASVVLNDGGAGKMEWKRDLLSSIYDDLVTLGEHREEWVAAFKEGRMPEAPLRFAGQEIAQEDRGAEKSLHHGLE